MVIRREYINDIIVLITAMNLVAGFVFELAVNVISSPFTTQKFVQVEGNFPPLIVSILYERV